MEIKKFIIHMYNADQKLHSKIESTNTEIQDIIETATEPLEDGMGSRRWSRCVARISLHDRGYPPVNSQHKLKSYPAVLYLY